MNKLVSLVVRPNCRADLSSRRAPCSQVGQSRQAPAHGTNGAIVAGPDDQSKANCVPTMQQIPTRLDTILVRHQQLTVRFRSCLDRLR